MPLIHGHYTFFFFLNLQFTEWIKNGLTVTMLACAFYTANGSDNNSVLNLKTVSIGSASCRIEFVTFVPLL